MWSVTGMPAGPDVFVHGVTGPVDAVTQFVRRAVSLFLVTTSFDITLPQHREIHHRLMSLGRWTQPLPTAMLVRASIPAWWILAQMESHLPHSESMLVVPVSSGDWASVGVGAGACDWLRHEARSR